MLTLFQQSNCLLRAPATNINHVSHKALLGMHATISCTGRITEAYGMPCPIAAVHRAQRLVHPLVTSYLLASGPTPPCQSRQPRPCGSLPSRPADLGKNLASRPFCEPGCNQVALCTTNAASKVWRLELKEDHIKTQRENTSTSITYRITIISFGCTGAHDRGAL